jgi:hypothetical protein
MGKKIGIGLAAVGLLVALYLVMQNRKGQKEES